MKKILLVILLAALILSMCGCNKPGFWVHVCDDFVDPDTGVHYLIVEYSGCYGFGMAPRYNADGTLMID